jgi:hypothetical protein
LPLIRKIMAVSFSVPAASNDAIYDDRAFDRPCRRLEEAGCTSCDILDHCRGPGHTFALLRDRYAVCQRGSTKGGLAA